MTDNEKREKDNTLYTIILGTVLVALGVALLLVVFMEAYPIVQDPATAMDRWAPEETQGPSAAFEWRSNGTEVLFNDMSREGDAQIVSWFWEFDDGTTSDDVAPMHTYSDYGDYIVSLEVTDDNDETARVSSIVQVTPDNNDGGAWDESFDMDFDSAFLRISLAMLVVGVMLVLALIGGKVASSGVQLLRPNIKTLKVKVKPKNIKLDFTEDESMGYRNTVPQYPPQNSPNQPSQVPTSEQPLEPNR